MLRTPEWWKYNHGMSAVLQPLSLIYRSAATVRSFLTSPKTSAIPVFCIGNVVAGGAGKTPTAIAINGLLRELGYQPCFLSRGYGGKLSGPLMVQAEQHVASDVGDEPLLLARIAPTIISRNRVRGLRLAEETGAECVIMDDGLQNPSMTKTASLLVVDGGYGLGNGRVLPAGPLREPWGKALARATAVVLIGEDRYSLQQQCGDTPVLRANLVPDASIEGLSTTRWLAFAGIGRPEKFFETLREMNANIVETQYFPDHHPYADGELQALAAQAEKLGAALITTQKDAVRLPPLWREKIAVLPIRLQWDINAEQWLRQQLPHWMGKR